MNQHLTMPASDFGGVWYWNRYPGARVDSEVPFYQLNIPEVYETWTFSQRFPGHAEVRAYFEHCDRVLNLRKDVSFNSRVDSVLWDTEKSEWHVTTETGKQARARYIVLATGVLHVSHTPQFQGMASYRGVLHHSSSWNEATTPFLIGKKVAIIGSGATSVQIVQELAKTASHLTMFMRRPPQCLPMYQRQLTATEQTAFKAYYPALFAAGRKSIAGFPTTNNGKNARDMEEQEREAFFERIWSTGGFQFQQRNFADVMSDPESNRIVYNFWKKYITFSILLSSIQAANFFTLTKTLTAY
jgi:cation diffusion facilitator CzcD-associated flavoprotein CzcO